MRLLKSAAQAIGDGLFATATVLLALLSLAFLLLLIFAGLSSEDPRGIFAAVVGAGVILLFAWSLLRS